MSPTHKTYAAWVYTFTTLLCRHADVRNFRFDPHALGCTPRLCLSNLLGQVAYSVDRFRGRFRQGSSKGAPRFAPRFFKFRDVFGFLGLVCLWLPKMVCGSLTEGLSSFHQKPTKFSPRLRKFDRFDRFSGAKRFCGRFRHHHDFFGFFFRSFLAT